MIQSNLLYKGTLLVLSITGIFSSNSTTFNKQLELVNKQEKTPVIIGYVGGFRGLVDVSSIAAEKLTHINYAFVNVVGNRAVLTNLKTDSINFRNLNSLKKKNPTLKILISLGGWTWSGHFSDAVLTDTSRKAFAASAVEIIRQFHLDGVDIDWEYPGLPGYEGNVYRPEDKENFTLMFAEIRKELDILEKETGQKKLLTTAVGGFSRFTEKTNMAEAQQYLDLINLMTYDFYGGDSASHHTNLFQSTLSSNQNSANNAVMAFEAAGVPIEKLVMGIAFYGRRFQLSPDATTGIGSSVVKQLSGHGYTFLKDSLIDHKGYNRFIDEEANAAYLFNAAKKEFITYDDEWSVRQKCTYVKEKGMAGVMFWEYSSDPKLYLLNEINKAFKQN